MTKIAINTEIRKVDRFVLAAEAEINAMGVVPRRPYRYPFDIVGLAMVSKAFALSKACLKLLKWDMPDEAYGLSRSIVECANNLRYLTEKLGLRTNVFERSSITTKRTRRIGRTIVWSFSLEDRKRNRFENTCILPDFYLCPLFAAND